MRMLLRIIMKTIFSVINVTVVLLILLYIFSVMGYQLFAGTYNARYVNVINMPFRVQHMYKP